MSCNNGHLYRDYFESNIKQMDSLSQRSQSRDDEFNETQQKLKKDQSQDKLNGKGKMRVSARSDKNNDHLPTKNPTKDRKDSRSRIDGMF